jgi:hypothetical protein
LKWNELVRRGDFVEDGRDGFELWDGPGGFRAASFVKQIYRLGGATAPADRSATPKNRRRFCLLAAAG